MRSSTTRGTLTASQQQETMKLQKTAERLGAAIQAGRDMKIIGTAGDLWGPLPKPVDLDAPISGNWAAESDEQIDLYNDPTATSTFWGFYPRHHRPDRIGASYYDYDEVYPQQRKGERYTSNDLVDRLWDVPGTTRPTRPSTTRCVQQTRRIGRSEPPWVAPKMPSTLSASARRVRLRRRGAEAVLQGAA